MRTRLALCVATCLLSVTVPSLRAEGPSQLADIRVASLLNRADQSIKALKLEEAEKDIDEAMALAEKIGDRIGIAMSHRSKGQVLRNQGKTKESIDWYEKAVADFEALGNDAGVADALAGLVASTAVLGDNARALKEGDRALALHEKLGDQLGRAHLLRGLAPLVTGDRRARYIQEIIDIGTRFSNDSLVGDGFVLIASGHFTDGNLAAARTAYERGIASLEKTREIGRIATAYLSLGRVFRAHGDYEGALQRYQRAIDLLAPTKERFTLVEATNAKALALGLLNRTKESIQAYEEGLALARESSNQRLIDFMEGNLATGLLGAGEYDRAIAALQAVIAKKPELFLLGYRHAALANALARVNRLPEAVESSNEGIRIAREIKQPEVLGGRLDDRASYLSKLGRYEEALTDSREAMAIVEEIRSRLIPTDFLKRGYAERVRVSYLQIVDLLSRLGRWTESLEFSEQGRARAFIDLLAARASPDVSLATRGEKPKPADSSGDLSSEALGRPLDLAGIKQVADRLKTTLVAFWVNERATLAWVIRPGGDVTHVNVPIARDRLSALVAATTAPLRETARETTTRGSADDATAAQATDADLLTLPMRGLGLMALSRDDKSAWRELYKTLIEPIRAQLPARGGRVTIIPHGPLFQLSLAALQNPAGRYLIEDYELHYAPAISALEFTGRRQQTVAHNAKGPWAIVGNPATLPLIDDRPLPPLPGAAREISAIAALAPKGSALRLAGADADEAALARTLDASHPSLLHFATHGFVFDDPKKPPFLALNRKGKTDADDGRLTLDEVYGLHLTTDLVVLSACRTGSGQVSSDGILGLTRGFFYAGSPSVMATFWDVTDEATANLMSGFYRNYVKTRGKGSSLRAAQLALLADLRNGRVVVTAGGRRVTLPEHPLLWAAFFLSGEP